VLFPISTPCYERLLTKTTMNSQNTIRAMRFNNARYIDRRLLRVPEAARRSVRTALRYIYLENGPRNLQRRQLKEAEQYLDKYAEKIVIHWLYTRTNGRLRKSYGYAALRCARLARYRCKVCGNRDVRVLEFDHIKGRVAGSEFACLCANCHRIKSRALDWTGQKRGRER
jgi:hypothetical protein